MVAPSRTFVSLARYPEIPIVSCDTRPLAEEWTYRWLGAALAELR